MGSTSSKTTNQSSRTSSTIAPSANRLSKRIIMRKSTIYPKPMEKKALVEYNNNKQKVVDKEQIVILRDKENGDESSESLTKSTIQSLKQGKKTKKSDAALSADDSVSSYHKTAVTFLV